MTIQIAGGLLLIAGSFAVLLFFIAWQIWVQDQVERLKEDEEDEED